MLFKLLLDILDVSTKGARSITPFPGVDDELSIFPMGSNFLIELLLEFQLLISGVGDIFNIIFEVQERGLHKLSEGESITGVWNIFLSHFNNFVPMSWLDRWLN